MHASYACCVRAQELVKTDAATRIEFLAAKKVSVHVFIMYALARLKIVG